VEEAHVGLGESSGEGALDCLGEVSFEHDGVADVCGRDRVLGGRGGDRDGFFDEGLFHAGAHVAEHEFEEVLGFERGGAAEESVDQCGAGGGCAGGGHGIEGFSEVVQGERGRSLRGGAVLLEEIVGGGAEVTVTAVGGG
jgi:hypothetical protein